MMRKIARISFTILSIIIFVIITVLVHSKMNSISDFTKYNVKVRGIAIFISMLILGFGNFLLHNREMSISLLFAFKLKVVREDDLTNYFKFMERTGVVITILFGAVGPLLIPVIFVI